MNPLTQRQNGKVRNNNAKEAEQVVFNLHGQAVVLLRRWSKILGDQNRDDERAHGDDTRHDHWYERLRILQPHQAHEFGARYTYFHNNIRAVCANGSSAVISFDRAITSSYTYNSCQQMSRESERCKNSTQPNIMAAAIPAWNFAMVLIGRSWT